MKMIEKLLPFVAPILLFAALIMLVKANQEVNRVVDEIGALELTAEATPEPTPMPATPVAAKEKPKVNLPVAKGPCKNRNPDGTCFIRVRIGTIGAR
ncbi:hypothetical protein ACFL2D_02565 [Patescibacteria group bacterium]